MRVSYASRYGLDGRFYVEDVKIKINHLLQHYNIFLLEIVLRVIFA